MKKIPRIKYNYNKTNETLCVSREDIELDDRGTTSYEAAVYNYPEETELLRGEDELFSNGENEGIKIKSDGSNKITNMGGLKIATTYQLENYKKKDLLIFNHIECVNHKPRKGTEKDVEALTNTFKKLGFDVLLYEEKTEREICKILQDYTDPRKKNFTNHGCIMVAVLTHGEYDGRLMAKDDSYHEQLIINYLNVSTNTTLINKPRIVFIQACRGKDDIRGVGVHQPDVHNIGRDVTKFNRYYTLQLEPDMLILHSSYIGSPAYRDNKNGSWFIQTLCKEIDDRASTEDLRSIITIVKRKIAIDRTHEVYDSKEEQTLYNKQMPVSTSTLTKKLYLREYRYKPIVYTDNDLSSRDDGNCIDVIWNCIVNYFYSAMECFRSQNLASY
ncbi:caspase-1-like isoform X3 [Galleria mellonella]|uniref:Caspase-1-like isoform X3 n=1 Tax=Galleria mellonella TaxID=7137 RepID=A0A6J3C343_GALME|nr:caspase-1-like isoform X3 [Galleria mellonella]